MTREDFLIRQFGEHSRTVRLHREGKANTEDYGIIPLVTFDSLLDTDDCYYAGTDWVYAVDIYQYKGSYVAVDEQNRI